MNPNAITWPATIGGAPLRLTIELDANGDPVDLTTAGCGKCGQRLDGLWRAFVKSWDINLKPGWVQLPGGERRWCDVPRVPVEVLLTYVGRRDESAGPTGDPLVPECGGHADYLARAYLTRIGRWDLLGGVSLSAER